MHSDAQSLETPPKTSYLPYGIIFLAALAALARQFIFPAVYQGADDDAAVLFKYIPRFVESFRHGILYPRWMPNDWGGYGSPIFVFYSPLVYILSSLLNMSGIDLVTVKTLLEFLRLYAGGVFIFMLVREGHGTRAGLASALFYTLLPGRVIDLYYISSPAARFAQGFMPMALFFTRRFVERPISRLNLAGASLSYAAIVLSHLATAYMFTPFLFLYGVFGTSRRADARTALKMLAGLGTGLLLSSFFFVPVLFERGDIQTWFMGRFLYGGNFLFGPAGPSAPEDRGSIKSMITGAVAVEAGMMAVVFYLQRKRSGAGLDREARFYLAAVLLCLFMMSFLSAPLWRYLPGLWTVQFPGRFESINLLFVSALLGVMTSKLFGLERWPWALTALGIALIAGVLAYDARLIVNSSPFQESDAVRVASYAQFPEYLPGDVDQKILPMLNKEDPPLSSGDDFAYGIARWDCEDRLFTVNSPRGARLRVRTFYFPGWRAWVDGKEAPLSVQDRTGAILMDVPAGRHEVEIEFTDTRTRKAGKVISLLTLIALVLPYGRIMTGKRKQNSF